MRRFLIALAACGGATTTVEPATSLRPTKHAAAASRERVDVIATLSKPLTEAAAIVPGPAELVLGGPPLQAVEGAAPVRGVILEEQGNDVRVGVRLPAARFALWVPRSRLLGVITREIDLPVAEPLPRNSPALVTLYPGALVHRLARSGERVQIRYVGAVEAEGWLPSNAVGDTGPDRPNLVSYTGGAKVMVVPGSIIRAEAKWAGQQVAIVSNIYFVDSVKTLDDAWSEVAYADQDINVHGFVSRRAPPGRIHRPPQPEVQTPPQSNANARDHTCLFINDEPIGFLDGVQPVVLDPGKRVGWQTLTIETPWHAIAFEVQGTSEADLATCGQ